MNNIQTYLNPCLYVDGSNSNYDLGAAKETGRDVSQSDVEAAKYYQLASDEGFAPAQFRLGKMYNEGKIIIRSNDQSSTQINIEVFKYYNLAAAQNFLPALNALGFIYRHGLNGCTQSIKKAVEYYLLAADQNFAPSQSNLSELYFTLGRLKEKKIEQIETNAIIVKPTKSEQDYESRINLGQHHYLLGGKLMKKKSQEVLKAERIKELHKKVIQYYNEGLIYYYLARDQNYINDLFSLKFFYTRGFAQGSKLTKTIFDRYILESKQENTQKAKQEKEEIFKKAWLLRFSCVIALHPA